MQEKIRDYLGVAGIIALIAISGSALLAALAYDDASEPNNYRSFTVTAESKKVVVPDVAELTFTVLTEGGKNLATLQKENADKANKAISFIKESGVEEKDIKTSSYFISPRYQYYSCEPRPLPLGAGTAGSAYPSSVCKPPEIVGYTIRQSVTVKVRNFDTLGSLISGVVERGANEVSGPQFTVDDPDMVKEEARTEAISKAREKAKAVARAGRFDLGKLLSISEGGDYPVPYMYARGAADGIGGVLESKTDVSIEPGSQEVRVTVTLQYEIED